MRVDLHNHTSLCKHASGTMEEYIQKAIKEKIDIFGFSCHNPMEFDKQYRMDFAELPFYMQQSNAKNNDKPAPPTENTDENNS